MRQGRNQRERTEAAREEMLARREVARARLRQERARERAELSKELLGFADVPDRPLTDEELWWPLREPPRTNR